MHDMTKRYAILIQDNNYQMFTVEFYELLSKQHKRAVIGARIDQCCNRSTVTMFGAYYETLVNSNEVTIDPNYVTHSVYGEKDVLHSAVKAANLIYVIFS